MAVFSRSKQCEGKRRFGKHDGAGRFLAVLRKRLPDAKDQHPYFCRWCEGWHLGHKSTDPETRRTQYKERWDAIEAEEGRSIKWSARRDGMVPM